jgi:hypothetical protein
MWPTLRILWLRLFGMASQKGSFHRRAHARCPFLEGLEDRTVPASLSYSTLLGGTVYATAVDSAGDVYVTGSVGSGLPTTPGAFQTTGSGAFVAKLNPAGTAVLYSTYLGNGSYGWNSGTSIAVDAAGDAYVIGTNTAVPTTANAIASSTAYVSGQATDFVVELNPTGSALLYGTYVPGTVNYGYDLGYTSAIAVDGSGNIYVAGAAAAGLPTTSGAFQTAYVGQSGVNDAFFAKINPALSGTASLVYASYLGGGQLWGDAATGIALDSAGNAYLEGYTSSSSFPITSGAFQTKIGGTNALNVFVAKFNPALSGAASLVYSTFLGGSIESGENWGAGYVPDMPVIENNQVSGGIAVDSAGNAYLTTATTFTNFPTTAGAYQTTSNMYNDSNTNDPASDVIVTKLNAAGSALVYSTYLGGGTNGGSGNATHSGGASIAVDPNGDAYVTGWTDSTSFPTKNPIQASNGGGYDNNGDGMDSFVTELNPSGSGLLFSTYLGGSSDDYGYGIALDSAGNVYVAGATILPPNNFPTTAGAYDTSSGSGFVAKINVAPSPSFAVAGFPSSTTAGVSHTFTVTALNADGSFNTNYTGTVHFTSSDPQAVLPADYTFSPANQGVQTFTVILETAGSQSITATDTVTGSITGSESGIVVNPGVATHFLVSGPSSIRSGTSFNLTVTALDAYGNVATSYTGTVKFLDSASGATLPGNYTFKASDAGVHTFTRLKLKTKGLQTLTIEDTLNNAILGTWLIDVT